MIKKANIQWSAKQLTKSIEKGTINFDNAVQRGLVWDDTRKSLLIHSMIEGYPIPAFYAAKNESGYDMLDGKQRSTTIADYINNKFELKGIPEVADENGNTIELTGLTFSELSEEMQDTIKDYSLTVYYFDGITEDEINEMFYRLNNGKPLTAIELTRVKAKSIEKIKEIGKHELFTSTLTEKAINKYTNEDITIKAWALLNAENPSFDTKYIRPLIESADITETQATDIKQAFTRILDTYKTISSNDDKESTKIAKRIITRTHLLSLVPVALQSINQNINVAHFTEFAKSFFNGKKSASVNDVYNTAAGSGSGKSENVKKRIDSIVDSYNTYFKKEVETKEPEKVKEESKPEIKHSLPQLETYPDNDSDWENSCRIPSNIMSSYTATMAEQ